MDRTSNEKFFRVTEVTRKELRVRELIEELLTVIANDDIGITADLLDLTLIVGEEHGLTQEEMEDILARG